MKMENGLETLEDLEREYPYDPEVFQERYQGNSPQEVVERLVSDISAFECGYGLQARVWKEIRDKELTMDDLVKIVSSKAIGVIKAEAAETLSQPRYAERLIDKDLARAAKNARGEKNQYLLEELLEREETDLRALKDAIDHGTSYSNYDPEMKRRFILKFADELVDYARKFPPLSVSEAKRLVMHVDYFLFGEEDLRDRFLEEYTDNLRRLVYKYLNQTE